MGSASEQIDRNYVRHARTCTHAHIRTHAFARICGKKEGHGDASARRIILDTVLEHQLDRAAGGDQEPQFILERQNRLHVTAKDRSNVDPRTDTYDACMRRRTCARVTAHAPPPLAIEMYSPAA